MSCGCHRPGAQPITTQQCVLTYWQKSIVQQRANVLATQLSKQDKNHSQMYLIKHRRTATFEWDAERAGDLVGQRRRVRRYDSRARAVALKLSHHFTLPFPMLLLLRRKTWLYEDNRNIFSNSTTTKSICNILSHSVRNLK